MTKGRMKRENKRDEGEGRGKQTDNIKAAVEVSSNFDINSQTNPYAHS